MPESSNAVACPQKSHWGDDAHLIFEPPKNISQNELSQTLSRKIWNLPSFESLIIHEICSEYDAIALDNHFNPLHPPGPSSAPHSIHDKVLNLIAESVKQLSKSPIHPGDGGLNGDTRRHRRSMLLSG
jgi:hypothetical protein